MVVSNFVESAKQNPVLLPMSGLTGQEWEALKLHVDFGITCNQQLVDSAKVKVVEFDKWMEENWSNV